MSATILIIEPNPGILIVGRNVLSQAGYRVLTVARTEHALDLLADLRPDVVLIEASEASADTLRSLRERVRPPPAIVITVPRESGVIEPHQGLALGVTGVVEKPFSPRRLIDAIEGALASRNGATETVVDAEVLTALRQELEAAFSERIETDRFPFADLLQRDSQPPSAAKDEDTALVPAPRERNTRLARLLRAELESEGVQASNSLIGAAVRAAERVVSEEVARSSYGPSAEIETPAPALEGSLAHLSLDQVLQLACNMDGPVRCLLDRDGASVEIFVVGSDVVFARQHRMPDGFLLGSVLVASGSVSEQDVLRSLDPRSGCTGWLGERLVDLGYIDRDTLDAALGRQSEELVYEVVGWHSGRFSLFATAPLPREAADARVHLPVQHLLLEGVRRLDEWQRLAGEVGDPAAIVEAVDPGANPSVFASLSPEHRMVLAHLDGRRTVDDLVRSVARPSFDVFRALHHLAAQRIVTVSAPGTA